jgi:RNA polymerase sigma-70 factor (ECF subfamily)
MASLAEKHSSTIDESVAALISRASNARGLESDRVRERVVRALEKYLFLQKETVDRNEIREFIEGIRPDDLCLIIACEGSDEKAWEDLIAAFDPTVKSAARKICSSAEEADDLANSVWAELYGLKMDADGKRKGKLGYYSGRGSLAGWLRAITAQLAIDQFRKQSKFVQVEEMREFENLAEESANHNDGSAFASHSENPEEIFGDNQLAEQVSASLSQAIKGLEPEDRLILKLYYFEDLKLKDIARTFGYHEATASRKLVRIQSDIRKSVEKSLRIQYGWQEPEVKKYLADAASSLGMSFEKLLGLMVIAMVVQDLWS